MAWWLWLAGAAVLMVAEMLTMSFYLACFGLGALAAALAAALGGPLAAQMAVFCLGSVAFLLFLRPLLMRRRQESPTNIDAYIGREAVALSPLRFGQAAGTVRVGGEIWSARLSGPGELPEGGLVRIEGREGLLLLVAPLQEGPVKAAKQEDDSHD